MRSGLAFNVPSWLAQELLPQTCEAELAPVAIGHGGVPRLVQLQGLKHHAVRHRELSVGLVSGSQVESRRSAFRMPVYNLDALADEGQKRVVCRER